VRIVLPLPVRPAHEAKLPPGFGRNLAAFELFERLDELVDVGNVSE
jgi:hypothetical protein